ncbi:MAG: DNA repair helicase XPB [Spirochaetales bacterium]
MNAPMGPMIVQSDLSVLLDVHAPRFEEAREILGAFALLEKSPEHLHTYRITPLSLWNASAAGLAPDDVVASLIEYSRYEVPRDIPFIVKDTMSRFGALVLRDPRDEGPEPSPPSASPAAKDEIVPQLLLTCRDGDLERRIRSDKGLGKWLSPVKGGFSLRLVDRGTVKIELLKRGWPVRDEASLREGKPFPLSLKFGDGESGWKMRPYQIEAVTTFVGGNRPGSGYGVIVLPCGSGKTIVGMAAMAALGQTTLIITTNIAAVHQWRDELLAKTDIDPEMIGEYTGAVKKIQPITIATYQILTWRPDKNADFPHFGILRREQWGLIVCDEVHLLPAPVFRVVAELQAVRRLGLTATLVREDGREEDVFCLIGPKRYDVPWKELEKKGFIAEAWCKEIRIPMDDGTRLSYAVAAQRAKIRIAAENRMKEEVVRSLAEHHAGEGILVIGQYIEQLKRYAAMLNAPLITGATPESEREALYGAFRAGEVRLLVVSKVANFAIDLPDASVAIQISGSFGSRQEEAQRLGRILRPKQQNSFFYSLVSRYSVEEEFADNRRRFLIEQGYRYAIETWDE